MATFKIALINWWPEDINDPSILNIRKNLLNKWGKFVGHDFIFDAENPDIYIHSCFGYNKPKPHKLNLYFMFENMENPRPGIPFNPYDLPAFGLVPDAKTSCNLPKWFQDYNSLLKGYPIGERKNLVCSVFNNAPAFRESIINHYKAERIYTSKKIDVISKYAYNIAVENSQLPIYITEKLSDACVARCIPIYIGGNLDFTPFNQERIIKPYDPLPIDYTEMINKPVFNNNHEEMYEERLDKFRNFFNSLI